MKNDPFFELPVSNFMPYVNFYIFLTNITKYLLFTTNFMIFNFNVNFILKLILNFKSIYSISE